MLRLLTAGESHGRALVAVLEGIPAGVPVVPAALDAELARRRAGYGRSARQRLEADPVTIVGGVRHGRTLGSPVALLIGNAEFEAKHAVRMAVDGEPDPADRLTRPRPGHADLPGMLKYGLDDARDVLERASARETAARVAAGYVCRAFLAELGIQVVSHVVRIGRVAIPARSRPPGPADLEAVDRSPVRCLDPLASARMVARIDEARRARDTLGGAFEVLAYGVPPGLGSHVQFDRKLDARLALALMSVQSVKGVEVGDGFALAARPGSRAHDEIFPAGGRPGRRTNRAGGIEGGRSNGEPIRLRAAMKPFSTLARPLATVDTSTGRPARAIRQRSDVCAVPAGAVVGEAVVAHVLADAALEKLGGDSVAESRRNLDAYLEGIGWGATSS
ncbi:MAG: chorismate synthase [Actinobacteria bacterium]|nr:chorismate synthase [Actinomycetota bacterium]